MLPQVRVVVITSLGAALWLLADGVRCLISGAYFSRSLSPADVARTATAMQLEDGRWVDYGRWGAFLVDSGFDPHTLAPFFVVLGFVGLAGLYIFLQARLVGWAMLVAFAALSITRLGTLSAVGGVLLVTLLLPWTWRLVTGASAPLHRPPPPDAAD